MVVGREWASGRALYTCVGYTIICAVAYVHSTSLAWFATVDKAHVLVVSSKSAYTHNYCYCYLSTDVSVELMQMTVPL